MNARLVTGLILAGSDVTLMARIRGGLGQLLTLESISSIVYQISNLTTGQVMDLCKRRSRIALRVHVGEERRHHQTAATHG